MRKASIAHIVLLLSILSGCCLFSSTAPSESAESLDRGIPGFASGLSGGLQGKYDKVSIVWKENKNQTSRCTSSSRSPVKKGMLPADDLLNAEPTGKFLYFVHGQNETRLLGLVPSETSDQNALDLLPIKGRQHETRKLQTSLNRKQGYSNLDTEFLKDLLKNEKNASSATLTPYVGEVAVINLKIKEILKRSESVKPNFNTENSSTEIRRQLIVSSETSQTHPVSTIEQAKMNVALLQFPNFKVMFNGIDPKFSWFFNNSYSDDVKTKLSMELNSVINTEPRITVSGGKVKNPMERFKGKIEFEMVNFPEGGSPKQSGRSNDFIVGTARTEQSKEEEQVKLRNAVEKFAPIINQSTSFSEITSSVVPVGTHVFSEETVPFLKKQDEYMKGTVAPVSSGILMLVSPHNYNFSLGVLGIHRNKQEEHIKSRMENLVRKRKKQLQTFSLSRTLPTPSVKIHDGFLKAVSPSPNKENKLIKNNMRSMSRRTNLLNSLLGGRSSMSLENFDLGRGFTNNDLHKREKLVKNGIERTETKKNKPFQAEVQRQLLTRGHDGSFVRITGVYSYQHETQKKNRVGRKVRRRKTQLQTFSEDRKPPIFLWKYHLPITDKGTYLYGTEDQMKNAVERTEKPLVTSVVVTFTPVPVTKSLDTFPNTQREQAKNTTEKTTGTIKVWHAMSDIKSPLISPTNFDHFTTVYSDIQGTLSDQQTNVGIRSGNVILNQTSLEPPLTRVDNLELRTFSKELHTSFENTTENKQEDVQPFILHHLINDLVMKITDFPKDSHSQETLSSNNARSLPMLLRTPDFNTVTRIDSTVIQTLRAEVSESKNRDL